MRYRKVRKACPLFVEAIPACRRKAGKCPPRQPIDTIG